MLEDPSGEVREAAALALGGAAPDSGAVGALVRALRQDPDWEVRAAAARSLGRAAGSDLALSALRAAAAGDAHPAVREVAESVLAALERGPARPGR